MRLQTHPRPPVPESRGPSAAWLTTLATSAALSMAWAVGWVIELSTPVMMAVTLAILATGVVAAALRAALTRRLELPTRAAASAVPAAMDDSAPAPFSEALHGKRWSLDVFQAIDAKRFAAVCETWFSWAGFDTRLESHRTDEGVDIWLHAPKVPGPVAIVRCRHWLNKPVDLEEMKAFLNVMGSFKSVHGTYTTTSTYTPEALQFAKEHGIDAVDGRGLLRRFQTRTRQRQQALLAIAFNGGH